MRALFFILYGVRDLQVDALAVNGGSWWPGLHWWGCKKQAAFCPESRISSDHSVSWGWGHLDGKCSPGETAGKRCALQAKGWICTEASSKEEEDMSWVGVISERLTVTGRGSYVCRKLTGENQYNCVDDCQFSTILYSLWHSLYHCIWSVAFIIAFILDTCFGHSIHGCYIAL